MLSFSIPDNLLSLTFQKSNLNYSGSFYHDINQFVTSAMLEMAQNLFIFECLY